MPLGNLRICHTADIQVKDRNVPLYKSSRMMLQEIEDYIRSSQIPIYIISGDLFEKATPNDSERELIQTHIARILQINTLKELVIIAGNHDLEKDNKQIDTQKEHNPINTFAETIKYFDSDKKLIYCSKSGIYKSQFVPDMQYLAYSLEDIENWDNIKIPENHHLTIVLFHAMLKEYVDKEKLPIPKEKKSSLRGLDFFPNNTLIAAGDIHQGLIFQDRNNLKIFVYPGSSMQHTFGEGSYFTLTNDIKSKKAENRRLIIYNIPVVFDELMQSVVELNSNNTTVYDINIEQKTLDDYVSYNTIKLDSNVPFEVLRENLKNIDIVLGKNQTFVKIKSSNIFIKKEQEIFELLYSKFGVINIEFEYDKFVNKETYVDNPIIQKIIDEKSSELADKNISTDNQILSEENIDDLLLNSEQLQNIADSIFKKQVALISDNFEKDINEIDVVKELSELFQEQLSTVTEQSSTRYKIVLKSIETNGFMLLGPNRIDLQHGNLVRILGTNGIGKTTLYRMIRWCITGMIFEGMSNSHVVKNNLLVFNNNLPDNNFVCVQMSMEVNGQPIFIKRTVERFWKQNVTEEQKLDENWFEYISSQKRNFELQLVTKSGETKTYTGEQAEKNLLKWFGETINNILIINYGKLESLLKTSPDTLNELILNYIGVDYLDKLEGNLDNLKNVLMDIPRPKRKREDIRENIIDSDIQIKNIDNQIKSDEKEILKKQKKQKEFENQLENINKKLIEIGDIPSKINQCIDNIGISDNKLEKYKSQSFEEKEHPKFDLEKPLINQKLIDENNSNIETNNVLLDGLTEVLLKIKNSEKELSENVDSLYSKSIEFYNNKKITNDSSIENKKKELDEIFQSLILKYKTTIQSLEKKKNEKQLIINDNKANLLSNKNTIKDLLKQIESGVCPTCNRPYESDEDWKLHKQKIEDNIKHLEQKNNQFVIDIESAENVINQANKLIEEYQNYIENCLKQNLLGIKIDDSLSKNIQELLDNIKQLESNNSKISNELIIIENIKKLKHYDYEIESKVLELSNNNIQNDINNIILKYKELSKDKETQENSKMALETKNKECQENVEKENKRYTEELEKYNNSVDNYRNICDNIDKENKIIREKKQEYQNEINNNQKLQNELKTLQEIEKPKYDSVNKEKQEIQSLKETINSEINSLNQNITSSKVKKVTYENQKETFNQELNNLIRYEKNNIIWKIYSKVIKSSFKESVFEYYRTYLNNTLNYLLSDVSFKLYWNSKSELILVRAKNGIITYQPIQLSSGMETTFLGLSLVYTMHMLNVKNTISHLFIDEISGTLNKGEELSYTAEDYQELFVKILSKFENKIVFIVDHQIKDVGENVCYEVKPEGKTSKYILKSN